MSEDVSSFPVSGSWSKDSARVTEKDADRRGKKIRKDGRRKKKLAEMQLVFMASFQEVILLSHTIRVSQRRRRDQVTGGGRRQTSKLVARDSCPWCTAPVMWGGSVMLASSHTFVSQPSCSSGEKNILFLYEHLSRFVYSRECQTGEKVKSTWSLTLSCFCFNWQSLPLFSLSLLFLSFHRFFVFFTFRFVFCVKAD